MKENRIISVDLGTRKSAIAILHYSNIIRISRLYAYNYFDSGTFFKLAAELIKETDFDTLVVEIPRAPRGKERISKEDFNKVNLFTKNFLENVQKITKENSFSIYTSYATNKLGYSKFKYNLEQVGWRQKLTGLALPNEKDIFYHIKNLENSKEIEFSEEALNTLSSNKFKRIFYDIIDAIGLGITFFKYPFIFDQYDRKITNNNDNKCNLKKVIGKNLTEEEVNSINEELYKMFLS